jgi:hypothetical protein
MAYSRFAKFLVHCVSCGNNTNKGFAITHNGKCKACASGQAAPVETNEHRQGRMIDAGWNAYAREEGHYDLPDWA